MDSALTVSDEQEFGAVREPLLTQKHSNMNSSDKEVLTDEGQLSIDDNPEKEVFDSNEKLPYPISAIFVLASKFCDRFAFNGAKTVLVMYLTRYLAFSSQDATVLYHAFLSIIFMMSILGAIIADSWLGKYKTVLYMFISYALGMVVLNLGSVPVLELPSREFTVVAMLMIAIGTGSMKPCLMALGGDQFKLPQQTKQLGKYYSWHYIALKLSFLIAAFFTPMLRNDVKCFGLDYCFPLAFGAPGTFVLVALVIFLIGSKWIVKELPTENVVVQVSKCIWSGAKLYHKNKRTDPQQHWLDHAIPQYGTQLVNDVKVMLNTIMIFLPVPVVYTLNDQTGSRWTLQATTLDGDLGFYEIKPDQMQFIMPVMIMIFITLLDCGFYSVLSRVGINSELRRMVVGAILTALAFVAAGVLELQTMPTLAVEPMAGHIQIRLYNSLSCGFNLKSSVPELNNLFINSLDTYETNVKVTPFGYINATFDSDSSDCAMFPFQTNILAGNALGILFQSNQTLKFEENKSKNGNSLSRIRILSNDPTNPSLIISELNQTNHNISTHSIDPNVVHPGKYRITLNNTILTDLELGPGSVTTLLYRNMSTTGFETKTIEITSPSSLHMLWMIPQYLLISLGEAIIGVTGLRFAYNEAPKSMKTVLLSCWLLAISAGNIIALIVVSLKIFETEAYISFLFAALCMIDSVWFMWIIKRYKKITFYNS